MRSYAEKRDFKKTSEPEFVPSDTATGPLRFVVQRHDATHLHFDLRLELDGALKSWAVPKGPSLNPKVRRQAIMVEDHPLAYAQFEGTIPKGEYGGGEVVIWDEGTYEPVGATGDRNHDETIARTGLAEGKLSFVFHGVRLRGEFTLVRARDESWLLIKKADAFASSEDPTQQTQSVRQHPDIKPMAAVEIEAPFDDPAWVWEPKLDGIRTIVTKQGSDVRLTSRTGNDLTARFPTLAEAVAELPDANLILDGEIVWLEPDGRPSFESLMKVYQGERPSSSAQLQLIFFDLLFRNSKPFRSLSFTDRRAALEELSFTPPLRIIDSFPGNGQALFDHALQLGFEGVIGKRLTSTYQSGKRSDDWRKVKGHHSEEFLIAGYTKGTGARAKTFGALLLAQPDNPGLRYCGNVGTGFSDAQLAEIRTLLDHDIADRPTVTIGASIPGKVVYVQPRHLAEVKFQNWTKEGRLRAPAFLRLRPDLETSGDLLSELDGLGEEGSLMIDGHPVKLTSLSKPLWPALTKRDLVRYFIQVHEVLLNHLRDRPLTVVRYPNGIAEEGFFQRHWDEDGTPPFARLVPIWSDTAEAIKPHLVCENLATLVWLAQQGGLELHPWHATLSGEDATTEANRERAAINHPDVLVCDLDPPVNTKKGDFSEEGWERTVAVALKLRELLAKLKLTGFVKTTGKSGLHVFVPLIREYDHAQSKEAARTIGRFLIDQMPEEVTLETVVKKRPHKVFFDANMNGWGRTLAGAYSPRPVAGGRVSCPLTWDELPTVDPRTFTIQTMPARLREVGDPWEGLDDPAARGRLA